MKNKTLVCILVLILIASFTGCNQPKEPVVDEPANVEEPAEVTNSVIIGSYSDIDNLDPHFTASSKSYEVNLNIYDTLIDYNNSTNEFIPSLAEKWTISEDGLNYTFNLRNGVKFHNGEELKANDVVFSLNRIKQSPFKGQFAQDISMVTALDEYTVQITLNSPTASFLLNAALWLDILNEKAVIEYGDDYGNNPVGTGPYQFVSHKIGQNVVLKRFDDYFNQLPQIKDVEYKIITDQNTALIALETGDVDFLSNILPIAKQSVDKNPKLSLLEYETTTLFSIQMNNSVAPFDNVLVRKAINYALNKEEIIQMSIEGAGSVANSLFNKQVFGYSENIKGYNQDIEKAKKLLLDAGYSEGFEITLKTVELASKEAQIIQEQLRNIGITVNIELLEMNALLQDLMTGNYTLGLMKNSVGLDADAYAVFYHSASQLNIGKYNNPRVDELFTQGKITLDKKERLKIYEELAQIIEDDAAIAPVYFEIQYMVGHKDLKINNIHSSGYIKIADMSWQ